MEPQWPLLQPYVPYVYGAHPAYQVQAVQRTNPEASLAYSFSDCSLNTASMRELSK